MNNQKTYEQLKELLTKVDDLSSSLGSVVEALREQIQDKPSSNTNAKAGPKAKPKNAYANSLSDKDLPPVDLTKMDELLSTWPKAVDESLILDQSDDEALKYRSLQILSILPINVKGLKVLDLGCGTGHTAMELSYQAEKVVAYDVDPKHYMLTEVATDNFSYAKSMDEVKQEGPYDFIMLYDVLDHAQGDPLELLKNSKELLNNDGTIFLRAHPWVSNTGGHLYETQNYGYLHLYLTPNEMSKLGYKIPYNIKVTRPMAMYEDWFEKAGLKVDSRKIKAQPFNEFYQDKAILDRIMQVTWGGKIKPEQAIKILQNDTIDYVLKHA